MKFSTKGVPTALQHRPQASWHHESADSFSQAHVHQQVTPDEHGRVLAILAMGGNDVPPTLVRRAIDEHWSVERAAREFAQTAYVPVG